MAPKLINELFAWISTDEEGNEGVIAILNEEDEWLPLIGADRERIEACRPFALNMARERGIKVNMIKLTVRENLE